MDAPTGTWPLSAAATALLQDPSTKPKTVMRLALKELVLRRAWLIRRRDDEGRRRSKKATLRLRRGDRPVPPLVPLPALDVALATTFGDLDEIELRDAVRSMVVRNPKLAKELRLETLEELRGRGLVELDRSRMLGRLIVTRTISGDSWVNDIPAREASLRSSIGRSGGEVASEVAALGGLALLLDEDTRAGIDDVVRRARGVDGSAGGGVYGGEPDDDDLAALDDIAGLDLSFDAFDAAVDAGGGDGGSGGGGGDGGG